MRIFIAAILPDEIKEYIGKYIHSTRNSVGGVKWEVPNKLHITLKFIGNLNKSTLDNICVVLNTYEYPKKSIHMRISGIDGFPNIRKPKVLIVKYENSDVLKGLRDYIENELSCIGIKKDHRDFVPHSTIGRINTKFVVKKRIPDIESREFNLVGLEIINSVLSKYGSDYFTCFAYYFG